jgi:hypothetical protein
VGGLDEFEQYPSRARGVNENIAVASRSYLDLVRNQPNSILLQLPNSGIQIGDAKRDMMQPFSAFGDEFGYN